MILAAAKACEVCGRSEAIGWPGAILGVGLGFAVAIAIWAAAKYGF